MDFGKICTYVSFLVNVLLLLLFLGRNVRNVWLLSMLQVRLLERIGVVA